MFDKIATIITVIMAAWGCGLSTYIYIESKESAAPTLYSTYTMTPEFEEPSKEGPKKVRLNIYISNAGKNPVEIPPSLTLITLDSKSKITRELKANLLNTNGEVMEYNIQNMLAVGEVRMYSTSYSDMSKVFTPYMSHVVQLKSQNSIYASITRPPMKPEALEEFLNLEGGLAAKYFGNLKVSPSKMFLQN